LKLIRKEKICKRCGFKKFLFGRGLCLSCYKIINPPFIKRKSDKKANQDKEYLKLRDRYLDAHPFCEINLDGCTLKSTGIHHMKGRGKYYLDINYFRAICSHCHFIITENSKEAIKNGHSKSRLWKI
jgi:ribosomal protein L37E